MSEFTSTDYAKLFSKMAQVMERVGSVEKAGYNEAQRYKYVKSDDVVGAVRAAMLESGLALLVGVRAVELAEIVTKNDKGAERVNTRALVHLDMTLCDTETGATITAPVSNLSHDTSDKAVNKAITAAKKYWLIATFLISTDEDDSDKSHVPAPRQAAAPKSAPEPASKPAPGKKGLSKDEAYQLLAYAKEKHGMDAPSIQAALNSKVSEWQGTYQKAVDAIEAYARIPM